MARKRPDEPSKELKCLRRTEELLTALVRDKLSENIKARLPDKKHRILYDLTGQRSIRELSQKTGFSLGKISRTWHEWEEAGLLVKHGAQYRRVL